MASYDRLGVLNIPTQMYMRFIFLRMVSFNVDYYWALNGTSGKASSWREQLEKYTENATISPQAVAHTAGGENIPATVRLQLYGIYQFNLLHSIDADWTNIAV